MDKPEQEVNEQVEEQQAKEQCEEQQSPEQSGPEANWERERQELVDQLLRLKADFANYKRRTEAQVQDIKEKANEGLLLELLPIIDNFERAVSAASEDSSLTAGVKMILQQLTATLEKQGLQAIESVGYPFNPQLHEAISMDGDSGDDLVVTVELLKGYIYKGKVLRASMVQVAPVKQEEDE